MKDRDLARLLEAVTSAIRDERDEARADLVDALLERQAAVSRLAEVEAALADQRRVNAALRRSLADLEATRAECRRLNRVVYELRTGKSYVEAP